MIDEHLRKFRMLPDGWHYGDGKTTTEAACTTALRLYGSFDPPYRHYEVFPKINGGVLLSCYNDDRTCIDFEIEPDGTYVENGPEDY